MDIDDFIEDSSVPLNFQSIILNSEVYRNESSAWQIGISHTIWSQKLTQVQSEVVDSIWFFYSTSETDLFQVERIRTEIGVEYDTLEMQLAESVWKQRYLEFPITYLRDVYFTKNNLRLSLGLTAIPGYGYTTHEGFTTLINQKELDLFNSSDESVHKLNFSGEIEARASKLVSDEFCFNLNFGFRNNFSGLFSSESQ